jgi:transposase InsO family protein
VFDDIEVFYNRQRPHAAIGDRTPAETRAGMDGVTRLAA